MIMLLAPPQPLPIPHNILVRVLACCSLIRCFAALNSVCRPLIPTRQHEQRNNKIIYHAVGWFKLLCAETAQFARFTGNETATETWISCLGF